MTPGRIAAVALAALACGAGVVALVLTSDHGADKGLWALFGPLVVWSFVGTGLYAWRKRPESRTGALMVMLGFAWCISALSFADSRAVYTLGAVGGGLWGGVFLHLVMTFPSGRIAGATDRAIVAAGYALFTLGTVPAMLVGAPEDLGCDDCPVSVLLIERDESLATAALAVQAVLYVVLLAIVLVRLIRRWRQAQPLARIQLTPVYVCGLITFLLATAGAAGAGEAAIWPAFIATAALPFAFLGGLLRSHVAHLDAELRDRLEELRASRARIVEAGDAERRRLERNLHDGAQARLVGVSLLLHQLGRRIGGDAEAAALLDRARTELKTSLDELRELARGIHPAALTERGLAPALHALAARAPVPVTIDAGDERLPHAVEIASYFVVSEALANVAKYAQATEAAVAVRRENGRVTVEISDDGVGGADARRGSGLRGLADRVAALDGTLAINSPPGAGTRLHVELPLRSTRDGAS